MVLTSDHLEFAQKTAARFLMMRGWPRAEREEGMGDALVGLVQASRSYVSDGRASFETYAKHRIRGAILDGWRQRNSVGRSDQLKAHSLARSIDLDDFDHQPIQVPDELADEALAQVLDETAKASLRKHLVSAINRLPEDHRLVVTLYFFEGMLMRQIGAALGVTESRVSQLLTASCQELNWRFAWREAA